MWSAMKELRMKIDLKQQDLSRLCGVSQGFLSRIETSQRPCPPKLMKKISRVLGVSIEKLFQIQPEIQGSKSILLG